MSKIRSYIRITNRNPLPPGVKPKWTEKDRHDAIRNYNKAQRKARKKHWDKNLENKKSNRDLGKLLTSLKPRTATEINCFENAVLCRRASRSLLLGIIIWPTSCMTS